MIRRTAAVTAASIAGVILAGGAAVGANIGILNAADDGNLGNLSAEAAIVIPTTTIDTPVALVPAAESTTTGTTQTFTVDVAGEIEVVSDLSGIRVSEVRPIDGWTWEEQPTTDGVVVIRFTSGDDELLFTASTNDDGSIDASVNRPAPTPVSPVAPVPAAASVVAPVPVQPQASGAVSSGSISVDDDEYEYEDHDDEYEYDDDEEDDHEEDDHEDDHDEYEGGEDDD